MAWAVCRPKLYMCRTYKYADNMAKMIQRRHVPDAVHRKLKARAAMKGLSLSDYLVREVTELANQPTVEEVMERIARRKPVIPSISPAEIIRQERDSR